MGTLSASLVLPAKLNPEKQTSKLFYRTRKRSRNRKPQSIVPLQGWYNKLQRDEVVAEWKKVKGKMSLHVHCHISGGHLLLDLFARLRYYIFCRELPVEASVWVYFHSNIPEFNKVECWGPLKEASSTGGGGGGPHSSKESLASNPDMPQPCPESCDCCFPPMSLIPWSSSSHDLSGPAPPPPGVGQQS
nr:protein STAY-GREEN, chloroplastic-like [Ipomoea batatas]GMD99921.1 protein STAY-GREEN, chloroplastic-like [Ipomoea batatas]